LIVGVIVIVVCWCLLVFVGVVCWLLVVVGVWSYPRAAGVAETSARNPRQKPVTETSEAFRLALHTLTVPAHLLSHRHSSLHTLTVPAHLLSHRLCSLPLHLQPGDGIYILEEQPANGQLRMKY
jgi:hypothetical protein